MLYQIKHKLKVFLRHILKSRFCVWLISSIIYGYALLVYKTTRWEIRGVDNMVKTWEKEKNIILTAWHGRALMLPNFLKYYAHSPAFQMDALVSLHQDGRLIAAFLQKFGIGIISGSTNRGAKGAAVGLMHALQEGHAITIISDGPRGPRMHMGKSPLYYASKTGKTIFGMTYSISNAKIIEKAWDKMMIPLPFSKGVCLVTEGMKLPENASEDDLEISRINLEKELNNINYEADTAVGRTPVKPALLDSKNTMDLK